MRPIDQTPRRLISSTKLHATKCPLPLLLALCLLERISRTVSSIYLLGQAYLRPSDKPLGCMSRRMEVCITQLIQQAAYIADVGPYYISCFNPRRAFVTSSPT